MASNFIKTISANSVARRFSEKNETSYFFTIALIAIFNLTACSTMPSAQKNQLAQDLSAESAVVKPAADSIEHEDSHILAFADAYEGNFDEATDEWEKARAAYLRDLDYAEVFHQHNGHKEYLLKSDLIESRYDVKSAETAMYEEQNFPKAVQQLQLAENRISQAMKLADRKESKALKSTQWNLDELKESARLSMHHSWVYPRSDRYHQIEAKMENLLITL